MQCQVWRDACENHSPLPPSHIHTHFQGGSSEGSLGFYPDWAHLGWDRDDPAKPWLGPDAAEQRAESVGFL